MRMSGGRLSTFFFLLPLGILSPFHCFSRSFMTSVGKRLGWVGGRRRVPPRKQFCITFVSLKKERRRRKSPFLRRRPERQLSRIPFLGGSVRVFCVAEIPHTQKKSPLTLIPISRRRRPSEIFFLPGMDEMCRRFREAGARMRGRPKSS